jgi:hypothetical protein
VIYQPEVPLAGEEGSYGEHRAILVPQIERSMCRCSETGLGRLRIRTGSYSDESPWRTIGFFTQRQCLRDGGRRRVFDSIGTKRLFHRSGSTQLLFLWIFV